MSKHTPGPWEVVKGGNFVEVWKKGKHKTNCSEPATRENGCLVKINLDYPFSFEKIKALLPDACLIAAAPALLEVLCEIVLSVRTTDFNPQTILYKKSLQAIAKVKENK